MITQSEAPADASLPEDVSNALAAVVKEPEQKRQLTAADVLAKAKAEGVRR